MKLQVFSDALMRLAGEHGVDLSPGQSALLYRHMELMLEWNRRMNLTRITEPGEILVQHILDSLLPARWLPSSGVAVDVGSGPGFPGVPLKILRPELQMVLLESQRKKVSFLRVLLSRLGLDGIWAVQGRWEDLPAAAHPPFQTGCSLITMRAVRLQREHITTLGSGMLRPGGCFAWWAGPENVAGQGIAEEAQPLGEMRFYGRFSYRLPSMDCDRQLLVWQRV